MDEQGRPGWNPPEDLGPVPVPNVAPRSAGPRRSRVGTGIAVAAIGIGALGVAGTAYASSAGSAPVTSVRNVSYETVGATGASGATGAQGHGWGRKGGGPGMRGQGGFGGGLGFGLGGAVRGSASVPKTGGGYQTIDMQTGKVDKVDSTSISVTSADGVTWDYVVNASTLVHAKSAGIGAVAVGDTVVVTAVENGSTRTALQIVDRTQVDAGRQQWAPKHSSGATGESGPNPTQTG